MPGKGHGKVEGMRANVSRHINGTQADREPAIDLGLIGAQEPVRIERSRQTQHFHDIRALSELLLSERNWNAAIEEYAERRQRYFDVILALDRWSLILDAERGEEADRLRESHRRAREADPTLGGFALIDSYGPDGLVVDEAARRHFYGEDLV
jgi:hypothetical protein